MSPARLIVAALLALMTLTGLTACAKQALPPLAATASFSRPVASVIDLMSGQIDPAADALWNSVATITDAKGTLEKQPRTDKEWAEVRWQALQLIEGVNLLVMDGRPVAHPGQSLENPPGAGDLSPRQSQAAIAAERQIFVAYARALQDAALLALRAIEARDAQSLLEAGGTIDEACEQCHQKFWYPGAPAPPQAFKP